MNMRYVSTFDLPEPPYAAPVRVPCQWCRSPSGRDPSDSYVVCESPVPWSTSAIRREVAALYHCQACDRVHARVWRDRRWKPAS